MLSAIQTVFSLIRWSALHFSPSHTLLLREREFRRNQVIYSVVSFCLDF